MALRTAGMMAAFLLRLTSARSEQGGSAAAAPTGLLVDWQVAPALGVSTVPTFGWVVPPCSDAKDAMQTGYSLELYKDGGTSSVWSSGAVVGNSSVNVKYTGPELESGTAYEFTVSTKSASCVSPPSARALFITAAKFDSRAKWIGAGVSNATFNILRRVVEAPAPSTVQRVVGYITAQNSDPTMLMNYKLYGTNANRPCLPCLASMLRSPRTMGAALLSHSRRKARVDGTWTWRSTY